MTADDTEISPGARLRAIREAAGKSRPVLAGLMGCSPETIKAIESGRRELTLTMAVRAARVLGVRDLAALYGPQVSYDLLERPLHEAVPAVRRALTTHRLDREGEPPSVPYLGAAVDSAWQTWHTSPKQRTEVGQLLPTLIIEARRAVAMLEGKERRAARAIASEVYHVAQAWLAWHGDRELVWLSADRAMAEAQAADQPLALAHASFYYAHLLRSVGQHEDAVSEVSSALALVEPLAGSDRDHASALVDLLMCGGLALARAGDESAWSWWERGNQAVQRLLPQGYAHPWTRIGRTMVDVFAVMFAVELGHGEEAQQRAADLDPAAIPSTERRARHLVELARAYTQRSEVIGAAQLLGQAVGVSVETVRFSPAGRTVARDLLRRAPAAVRPDLQAVAARLGVVE